MIFADASALIAMIAREPEATQLAAILKVDPVRLCSAVSAWETVAGLSRSYNLSVSAARARVRFFLKMFDFRHVVIGEAEFEAAAEAYERFGKGRHPAALNMGDCYAYACAKTNQASLLFIGNDFTKTDVKAAR
jgi:ribonuclease VapC